MSRAPGASAGRKSSVWIMGSASPQETHEIGRRLGGVLTVPGVVLLSGMLGSGKTTMARGIAHGLGMADPTRVHSPSFTIANIYHGRCTIYHVDLYRVHGRRELRSVGLEDFCGKDGITIVEWGELLKDADLAAVEVFLEDKGKESRTIRIECHPGAVLGRPFSGNGGLTRESSL